MPSKHVRLLATAVDCNNMFNMTKYIITSSAIISLCYVVNASGHNISVLSGGISTKLGTNIHHVSGNCSGLSVDRVQVRDGRSGC